MPVLSTDQDETTQNYAYIVRCTACGWQGTAIVTAGTSTGEITTALFCPVDGTSSLQLTYGGKAV